MDTTFKRIETIRAFNRFYTRRIGVLREGLSQSRFSLTEARVLYELAQGGAAEATGLAEALELDAGYLSRILKRFEQDGLLVRLPSPADRRRATLALTDAGHAAFRPLQDAARAETGAMLANLPEQAQERLVACLAEAQRLLGSRHGRDVTLRELRPGDIGWVIGRHGALYAEEYEFDHRFEALVARVGGAFLAGHDTARERGWIAEVNGARAGSVFLVRESDETARIRLLIVEPAARGLGIGGALVDAALAFARNTGYRSVTLWTNEVLVAARAIYRARGFRLTASKPHSDFGPPMVGEDWDLAL